MNKLWSLKFVITNSNIEWDVVILLCESCENPPLF